VIEVMFLLHGDVILYLGAKIAHLGGVALLLLGH